ncbi:hypothetical protein D3C85_1416150 [compost metagenome]
MLAAQAVHEVHAGRAIALRSVLSVHRVGASAHGGVLVGRTDGSSQQLLYQYFAHELPVATGIFVGRQVVLVSHPRGIAESYGGGRQITLGQLEDAVGEGLAQAGDIDSQWFSVAAS